MNNNQNKEEIFRIELNEQDAKYYDKKNNDWTTKDVDWEFWGDIVSPLCRKYGKILPDGGILVREGAFLIVQKENL